MERHVVEGHAEDGHVEQLAAVKHDLGKYCAWQSANLDDEAWTGPVGDGLVSALCSDLLATKTGPGGDRTAWEVWARHAATLPRPWDPPELAEVDAAVGVLKVAESALRSGDRVALGRQRAAIRAAQRTIRRVLAAAHRTTLRRAESRRAESEAP